MEKATLNDTPLQIMVVDGTWKACQGNGEGSEKGRRGEYSDSEATPTAI